MKMPDDSVVFTRFCLNSRRGERDRATLDEHDHICARAVEAGRGRTVKLTGDGVLATFDAPASAVAAAHRMIQDLALVGLHIRAGVHTGEVERRGDDIGGDEHAHSRRARGPCIPRSKRP